MVVSLSMPATITPLTSAVNRATVSAIMSDRPNISPPGASGTFEEEEITAKCPMPIEIFHRHQTIPPESSDERDTQSECPVDGCVGGEIRAVQDDGHRYAVSISTCTFCQGLGVVPPWLAASWRAEHSK